MAEAGRSLNRGLIDECPPVQALGGFRNFLAGVR